MHNFTQVSMFSSNWQYKLQTVLEKEI